MYDCMILLEREKKYKKKEINTYSSSRDSRYQQCECCCSCDQEVHFMPFFLCMSVIGIGMNR